MSVGIFFQLLVCASLLAIYMVGIEADGNLGVNVLISLVGVAANVIISFLFCFLSENLTHKLSTIGDHFYNYAWYRLPIKQQQLFIFPIQRTQKEFRINGLGIVECSLKVFVSVNYYHSPKLSESYSV